MENQTMIAKIIIRIGRLELIIEGIPTVISKVQIKEVSAQAIPKVNYKNEIMGDSDLGCRVAKTYEKRPPIIIQI